MLHTVHEELTCIHGNTEASALLSQEAGRRNFDIVHHNSTGWLSIPAHFLLCFSKCQAWSTLDSIDCQAGMRAKQHVAKMQCKYRLYLLGQGMLQKAGQCSFDSADTHVQPATAWTCVHSLKAPC